MDFKKKMKKFFTLTRKAEGGFTLVELIVVIAILAVLAGITVPAYGNYVEKAKEAADKQTLAVMNTAFTAACMDNRQYDMTAISPAPTASIASDGTVSVEPYNTEFQGYFGGGTFQYYDRLNWNDDKGVFEFVISSFAGGAVMDVMRETLDGISNYFSADETMVNLLRDTLLANTSTTLSEDVLKFDSMFDGLNAAMSEEAIKDYLESKGLNYDDLTDEQKAAVKGNLGVMYFASDADKHTAEEVMQSLGVVAQVLGASGEGCTQDVFEKKYLQNLSQDEQEFYKTNVKNGKMTYEEFLQRPGTSGGDFSSSYGALIQMEMAAEALKEAGVSNTTGVSTLGAMYALSAGYFNSDYYTGGDENKPDNYGDFDSVQQAMGSQGFDDYLEKQGLTDLEYYLDYMASLDMNEIDLRNPNAFAGLNTQN